MLGAGKSTLEIVIAAKDRTKAAFAKVNAQMTTMKGGAGRLGGAMNTLKGGISSATSSLGSLGAALGPLGIAVAAAAVVMATFGGAAIKASLEFEKAFATIRVGTGATGEALAGLEGSFKTVFTSVPASTADAATAIADLNTRLGLTGEPLEALATQFLNLSRITGTDVAASISSATRVMHDFDVSTKDQAGALDYLFKVSQSTGLGMTQLSSSMTQYGSVMRQMGFDINESAALLGKFEKEGVNLELVLGSLRQGLAKFSKAGEEPVEALARVSAEIQGMGSVADANALAIETFGARAGPDMAAAIREGRFSIGELMSTLDASSETINKAAADTLQFGDKWILLKNKVTEAIAPIGDVIKNVLGNAIEGLSGAFDTLQKIAGPALKMISIHFKLLAAPFVVMFAQFKTIQAFFEGFAGPIIAALAPLRESFEALQQKFKEGSDRLTLFSDIFTIITGAAKWLGEAIGTLVGMALTPLITQLKEGIDMLSSFYDKLGPIKGALEWVGESIHNVAESFRDAEPPIKEVKEALEELADTKAPQAIADAWAIAVKAFQDGAGTYKDAVTEINKEVEALKEEWKTATDERKAQIDKTFILIHEESEAVEALNKGYEDHFDSLINDTDKAIEKTKDFIVTIGDTTIEFKGAAAEVLKNADAYEKLQKSARTLIDLDWSVFTEFEAALPRIDAGLGDMESSFVGLKGVLEDNIVELENVKQSVIDISEIATPFLEAGFLDGIKAIGDFASTLKDASSAISDFSSLQDVSIEGCINFSRHVQDMVTALGILESQMVDLVPSFEKMNFLIGDIKTGFLSGIDITALYGAEWADLHRRFQLVTLDWEHSYKALAAIFGLTVEEIKLLKKEGNLATFAFMKQTNALKAQTEQLAKITDALQPYLNFMRTLNELAALSTLSTEELNNGLNSIKDTLINLGTALSSFDLRSAMEGLFAPDTGSAKGFMDVMEDYNTDFLLFASTLTRITEVIGILSVAMENAAGMVVTSSRDMEAAMKLIPAQLEEIATFLRTDLWSQIVAMLFAVNVEWEKFEDILETTSFSKVISTISNLIGLMNSMKDTFSETSEQVVISAGEIEIAMEKVDNQLKELETYLMSASWDKIVTMIFAVGVEWQKDAKIIEDYMPSFNAAVDTISTLASKVLGLSESLIELRDMSVLSVRDIDEALKKIPVFLNRFVDALALNMGAIKQSLKELDKEWSLHAEEMKDTMPSYEDSTAQIGKLVGSLLSLNSALKQLAAMGTISGVEFDTGFKSLMESISNFAVSLAKNVDGLIDSLSKLSYVWNENKATLVPLMDTFLTVTYSFWEISNNANAMAESFRDLQKNSGTLEKGFKSLIDFINQVVKSTKEFYTTEAAAELATFITDVGKVIDAFVDLERDLNTAMGNVENAISDVVDDIHKKILTLSKLPENAYVHGANTLQSFVNGLIDKEPALEEEMQNIADIIHGFLGVESPTKLGPLQNLDRWGPNLVRAFSTGIESELHTLNSGFASMLVEPSGMGSYGGSNRSIVLNITQHISDKSTADYANNGIERLLSRHSVM